MDPREIRDVVKEVLGELAREARTPGSPPPPPPRPVPDADPAAPGPVLSPEERRALERAFGGSESSAGGARPAASRDSGRIGAFDDPPACPLPERGPPPRRGLSVSDAAAFTFAAISAGLLAFALWARFRP